MCHKSAKKPLINIRVRKDSKKIRKKAKNNKSLLPIQIEYLFTIKLMRGISFFMDFQIGI